MRVETDIIVSNSESDRMSVKLQNWGYCFYQ